MNFRDILLIHLWVQYGKFHPKLQRQWRPLRLGLHRLFFPLQDQLKLWRQRNGYSDKVGEGQYLLSTESGCPSESFLLHYYGYRWISSQLVCFSVGGWFHQWFRIVYHSYRSNPCADRSSHTVRFVQYRVCWLPLRLLYRGWCRYGLLVCWTSNWHRPFGMLDFHKPLPWKLAEPFPTFQCLLPE